MDRRNSEGYPDPTVAEALSNVAREEKVKQYRPLVYICSPFAGETEYNISRARGYCRFAISKGCIPLAPHLLFPQFMDESDRQQRELGLFFALVLLGKCNEVWVFGSRISDGMSREIAEARKRGLPIRYWNSRCEEVMPHGLSR
ncbi:hypothetical protein P22_2467 [Propionispora sp. 2/2-37]|uniref:DUF7768 domain-containing protein n=1 Tax=Propionispora sp. 2/2-37 TaxID=1677858 RepID=UPI0006BB56A8|nr:DUF4406 domain-containing protein [Propionispora sp. 2/2-37]CUH96377.1 hypothetical protein P22_2467 [Propionispora sp. 2/2-37]